MLEVKDVDFDTENVEGNMDELENMPKRLEDDLEPKVDGKTLEQAMITEAQNRAQDPAETAAMVYTMYRAQYLARVNKLSNRARNRVLNMIVQYPLNGENIKFTSDLEKEVYFLADSMVQAKFVLMLETYKEGAEHLVTAQEEFIFNAEEKSVGLEGESND